jgi:hypothetical protein
MGIGALSLMRYEKSAERIAPLVLLEIVGVRDHPRGPRIERVVTCERFRQLLCAIDGERLGWL